MSILTSTNTGMYSIFSSIGTWLSKYAVLDFQDASKPVIKYNEDGKICPTMDGYLCKWNKYATNGTKEKWIGIYKDGDMFVIDTNGVDLLFVNYPFAKLFEGLSYPIRFGEINGGGSFICSHSHLSSLEGFPIAVGGIFDISHSQIRDITNSLPKQVNIDFFCYGCGFTKEQITSYTKVTHNIYC